jgi:predicted phosphohydrolase
MRFAFDLISDLHVETWPSSDWTGQATSPYCIVAGDVARDRSRLIDALAHLGACYPGGVFYMDGNEEHKDYLDNLNASYDDLGQDIERIPNVVYLQDNLVIINGVAIIGTNAWWTYDFDPKLNFDHSVQAIQDHFGIDYITAINIAAMGHNDANYLTRTVKKLQIHQEVTKIIIVTHTVPAPWIIAHDADLADTWRFNGMGNGHLAPVLREDTEQKIHTWCFGHYHRPVDQVQNHVRYVSNPRGRGNTEWSQQLFYPKRIEVTP